MGWNSEVSEAETEILCWGHKSHVEIPKACRQQKEFGKVTLKNELLLLLELEKTGSPSNTEVLLSAQAEPGAQPAGRGCLQ